VAKFNEGEYYVDIILADGSIRQGVRLPIADEDVYKEIISVLKDTEANGGTSVVTIQAA
jgi:hypothetical protein